MSLKEAFERILRMGEAGQASEEGPDSIVLLLKEPHFPNLERLRLVAGRAFGTSFSGDRAARHSVYQRGVIFTLANVGVHTLSFLFYTKPYFSDEPEHARAFERSLRRDDQRQAWAEHNAYMAVDYVKGDVDRDSKYVVLALLCAELFDENCMAIYLPKQSSLVPGKDSALGQLNKIIAYKKVNTN